MTSREMLETLNDKELLNWFIEAGEAVEHYKNYGYWGDGKLETAKAERKLIKHLVLERMGRGNV